MSWLDRFERNYSSLAIPGLIRYVAFLMFIVFVLDYQNLLPYSAIAMNSELVMHGQFWRLITFLFIPISSNPFFLLFELMILVMVGDGLESEWGSFQTTVYYLCGGIATILAAFLLPGVFLGSAFLNLSLFLAFATVFPDFEILLFFILPVKVKYLAMISGAFIVWEIAVGSIATKIFAVLSIANYLIFFGPEAVQMMARNRRNLKRRHDLSVTTRPEGEARHTCTTCLRTELTNPDLEFRYCTCPRCGPGGKPFCEHHLPLHKAEGQAAAAEKEAEDA